MRNLVVFFIHFSATLVRLLGPAGRSLVAKSLVLKHQRVIVNLKPSPHWVTSAKLCGKQVLGPRKTASSLRLLRAGDMYCTPAIGISSASKPDWEECLHLDLLREIESHEGFIAADARMSSSSSLHPVRSSGHFRLHRGIERCEYPLAGRPHCD